MIKRVLLPGCVILCGVVLSVHSVYAAPIRSDKDWDIYTQQTAADWEAVVQAGNLAAGKLIQAQPAPNYAYSGTELKNLTDGVLAGAEGRMWTDKRAVGWAYQDYVRMTLDLGQPQPLGQVVLRLQIIGKDNTLPKMISASLSNDGDYYSPIRRLSAKVHPEDNPALSYEPLPTDTPGIYAVALNLGYQARYVRLDFATQGILVTDEIAVTPALGQVQQLQPPPEGKREYQDNVFDRRDQFSKLIAPGDLILGKELRYAPQPNYRLTTNDTDNADLTDGQLGERTDEAIWFEKGAVGWQFVPRVTVFADLGAVQPIASVVARFLGGAAQPGLTFPDEVRVLLSNDGKDYYQVASRHKRGLDDRSSDAYNLPEVKIAWVHNFALPVGLKARYVAVQVYHQKQFICTDEIAVVKGADNLPGFQPIPDKQVTIVTSGVAFSAVNATLPVCQNMPLRTKLSILDARSGQAYNGPCKLLLDLSDTIKFMTEGYSATPVEHEGRKFSRYVLDCNRGDLADFYLQSLLPAGKTDVIFTYGDAGQGPENERKVTWESLFIPTTRQHKRLHISLAWSYTEFLYKVWPDYFSAMKHLGFNCLATFPRYWAEKDVAKNQAIIEEARQNGFQIIVNESPAGALVEDWNQPEIKSQFPDGKLGESICPSYRGQYYRKELVSFGKHAVWLKPDYIFYDIEAFWPGAGEAPRCTRCQERFKAGGFKDWDEFRRAMGKEYHQDMQAAIEKACADTGIKPRIIYGSYRTEPISPMNDGLFVFEDLYPDLLQIAMPSLYVAGNPMAVADSISQDRARMQRNDIIPWLSTGCAGDYEQSHTRDMVLETFANGARGVTYYWYGDFDPAHFKYHAEAVDIVAPVEDIFVDGKPLTGLKCDNGEIKVCGMGAGNEMAVLVSNYKGVPPGTKVTIRTPAKAGTSVWDLHTGKQITATGANGSFTVSVGDVAAHMYYVGSKYAKAVAQKRP